MFNQFILCGYVALEPVLTEEKKYKILKLRIAVKKQFRERESGEYLTEFFTVTLWQGLAQQVASQVKKGTLVIVKGRVKQAIYQNKEGKRVERVELEADRVLYTKPNDADISEDVEVRELSSDDEE